jgi:hypothetical protein
MSKTKLGPNLKGFILSNLELSKHFASVKMYNFFVIRNSVL